MLARCAGRYLLPCALPPQCSPHCQPAPHQPCMQHAPGGFQQSLMGLQSPARCPSTRTQMTLAMLEDRVAVKGWSPLQLELVDSLSAPDHIDCLDAQVLGIGDQLLPQRTRGSILQQPALTKARHMPAAQLHPKALFNSISSHVHYFAFCCDRYGTGCLSWGNVSTRRVLFYAACPELCTASAIVANAATLAV